MTIRRGRNKAQTNGNEAGADDHQRLNLSLNYAKRTKVVWGLGL
jgi:hypothetical protein